MDYPHTQWGYTDIKRIKIPWTDKEWFPRYIRYIVKGEKEVQSNVYRILSSE